MNRDVPRTATCPARAVACTPAAHPRVLRARVSPSRDAPHAALWLVCRTSPACRSCAAWRLPYAELPLRCRSLPGDRRAAATATAAATAAVRHQRTPRSLLKEMPIKGYRGSGALLRIDISNTTTRWRFMVTQPRCKPGLVLGGSAAHHTLRCPPSSQASMSSNETEPAVQVVRAFQVSLQPVLGHTRSCGDHRDSGGLAMCRESERLRGDVRIHPPVMHLCAHRYNNCICRLPRGS